MRKTLANERLIRDRSGEAGFSLIELMVVCVVLVIILGVIVSIITNTQSSYAASQQRTEAINDASAAMDTLSRLLRNAGNNTDLVPVAADPNNDGVFEDVQIRGDWNPADGALDDAYENIKFRVNNGVLEKNEPSDGAAWVPFEGNVQSITFRYFDKDNNAITAPQANEAQIVGVRAMLVTGGQNPMTFTSYTSVRKRRS